MLGTESQLKASDYTKEVNMLLNVHRNHKVYHARDGEKGGRYGRRRGGGGMEGVEGDYILIARLSPPE